MQKRGKNKWDIAQQSKERGCELVFSGQERENISR